MRYVNREMGDRAWSDPVGCDRSICHRSLPIHSLMAKSHLTRRLFGSMVRRIAALPLPAW
jgi:hypothetical protein